MLPTELPSTVRPSTRVATNPGGRPRDGYVDVARATRLMVRRLAVLDPGRPRRGAAGDREVRLVLALISQLTTWCRLDDRLARAHLARLVGRSEDTVSRGMAVLAEATVVRYAPGRGGRLSRVGLPRPDIDGGQPPSGEPAGLAAVSETTRALIAQALRADLSPSALLLVAVLIAELTTWTRLEGDLPHGQLMASYGFSRSSLQRAYVALERAGLVTYTPGRGQRPTRVALVAAHGLDVSGPAAAVQPSEAHPAQVRPEPAGGTRRQPLRHGDQFDPALQRYVTAIGARVARWGGPAPAGFLNELDRLKPTSLLWPLLAEADAAGWDPGQLAYQILDGLPAEARSSWVGLLIGRLPTLLAQPQPAGAPVHVPGPQPRACVPYGIEDRPVYTGPSSASTVLQDLADKLMKQAVTVA